MSPDSLPNLMALRAAPPGALAGRGGGFSLIEVILAIGLVTFSMLMIFSLMPTGLAVLDDSNRQIVETEIFNAIGAELAATPFGKVEDYVSTRFPVFYDAQGLEVPAASGALFTVGCELAAPELGAGELRRATVLIGYRQDPAQTAPAAPRSSVRRTCLLVNNGVSQ